MAASSKNPSKERTHAYNICFHGNYSSCVGCVSIMFRQLSRKSIFKKEEV